MDKLYRSEINYMYQNRKCRLSGDRDEKVNPIISECSKLAQKEDKTRHDWVGKMIHWELCKCMLWSGKDETVNHIISECSKLAQKEYKKRHDWVGKVIN